MDKAYIIKYNILEQYVLGELNNEELTAVEKLLNSDTELKAQLEIIESKFETIAFENAIQPPKVVKKNLMASIVSKQGKVIPISKTKSFKRYFAVAASVAAILFVGNLWMFNQFNKTKQKLQIVNQEKDFLLKNVKGLNKNIEASSKWVNLLNSPDTKQYILKGNTLSPDAKVISYVNHSDKSVWINTNKLPKLDANHDYQMWADVDGEMINMGVINPQQQLLAMNYVDHAESLNITIEPAGGSEHPTVSNLITNVYL